MYFLSLRRIGSGMLSLSYSYKRFRKVDSPSKDLALAQSGLKRKRGEVNITSDELHKGNKKHNTKFEGHWINRWNM